MRLTVHVDGGARGNPGPAAIGVVVSDADGDVLDELGETNRRRDQQRRRVPGAAARASSAPPRSAPRELELVNDSELVAKQLTGVYKVKHPAMKPLHEQAIVGAAGL